MEIQIGACIVIVDEEDEKLVSSNMWWIDKGYVVGRILSSEGAIPARLHRVISQATEGMVVDHINGVTTDNRRSNLRVCTHAENMRNRKIAKSNSCGIKGIYFDKRRIEKPWFAQIRFNRKKYFLGYHETPEQAASAYAEAAIRLHGSFARLT